MPSHRERSAPLLDREWLSDFRETLAAADGLILCLDYDGTLAPIVDDPEAATMSPENRRLLQQLVAIPGVTVAVVSGRSLADLRERVDVDGVHYAGNHGLEWDGPAGRDVAAVASDGRQSLTRAAEQIRSRLTGIPGYSVEEKGLTVSVHHRQVPDAVVPTVIETTETVVDDIEGFDYRHGKAVLEIHPDDQDGKGRIIDRLRERRPDAALLAVGDDVTDEDAFRAAEPDGVGVLVGDREGTNASVRVRDPEGVTTLLSWLVATPDWQSTGSTA